VSSRLKGKANNKANAYAQLSHIISEMNKSAAQAVMLFPVKLETKYTHKSADQKQALRIRIYPDLITLRANYQAITSDEQQAAKDFWKNCKHSEQIKSRWKAIANHFGAARAAYVLKVSKPVYDPNSDSLSRPPLESQADSWFVNQCLEMLPERFTFVGVNANGERRVQSGKRIDERVKTLSFENTHTAEEGDIQRLLKNSSAQWITDYALAEELGMAITIEASSLNENDLCFDKIVVMGTCSQSKPEDLFEAHLWGQDDFSIVPVGTPTNNTKQAKTGISEEDELIEHFFETQIKALIDGIILSEDSDDLEDKQKNDGEILAPYLALAPQQIQSVVNSSGSSIQHAKNMNRVLFDMGIGNVLAELCGSFVDHQSIAKTKDFYCQYVSARGYLPGIRIGSQPYGLLPTTAFSRFQVPRQWDEGAQGKNAYWSGLWGFLKHVQHSLDDLIETNVETKTKPKLQSSQQNSQQHFVNMLRNNPVSQEFHYRSAVNSGNRISPTGFSDALQSLISFVDNNELNAESLANDLMRYFDFSQLEALITHVDLTDAKTQAIHDLNQFQHLPSHVRDEISDYKKKALKRTLMRLIYKSRALNLRLLDSCALYDGALISPEEANKALTLGPQDNYITWLANCLDLGVEPKIKELEPEQEYQLGSAPNSPKSGALLFFLLRQSLLQMMKNQAVNILIEFNYLPKRLSPRSNHVHYQDYGQNWPILFKALSVVNQQYKTNDPLNIAQYTMYELLLKPSLVKHISQFGRRIQQANDEIEAHKQALQALATCPIAELRNLFAEQVDLSTYRLDAWLLGFANKKLHEQMQEPNAKMHMAAYGYLENVKPATRRVQNQISPLLKQRAKAESASNSLKVFIAEKNQGAVHAPSLNQAVTAGILRAGFAEHQRRNNANSRMAINLNSKRVRNALKLLDGVRKGIELSALLGYRLERSLHDHSSRSSAVELNHLILPLRQCFPYHSLVDATQNLSQEEKEIQVINGLDLVSQSKALNQEPGNSCQKNLLSAINNNAGFFKLINAKKLSGSARLCLVSAIVDLIECLDALADLALSESVYHVVQGNYTRASVVMKAIAAGDALPDIDVVNTPLTGTHVQHRCLLQFPMPVTAVVTPLAACDPYLNAWLSQRLPDFSSVSMRLIDIKTGEFSQRCSLADLKLEGMDLLVLFAYSQERLEQALIALIQGHFDLEGENALDDPQPLGQGQVAISTLYYLLQECTALLKKSKNISQQHFTLPEHSSEPEAEYDFDEFIERLNSIELMLSGQQGKTIEDYRWCLADDLSLQSLVKIKNEFIGFNNSESHERLIVDKMQQTLKLIFIDSVLAFPLLKQVPKLKQAPDSTEHGFDLKHKPQFKNLSQDADYKKELWLASIAKVRSNMASLSNVRLMSEHLGADSLTLSPLQYPKAQQADHEQWFGIELQTQDLKVDFWEHNRLSLNIYPCYQATQESFDNFRAGVLLDEWTELIPATKQTTGVAFNIDQPDATPPQSILLAVNPKSSDSGNWTSEELLDCVFDTMDLLKLRLLEPEHVNHSIYGQFFSGMNIEAEVDKPTRVCRGRLTLSELNKLKALSLKDKIKAAIKAQAAKEEVAG